MDKRISLIKQTDSGLFIVKKSYLRAKNESGYLLYRVLRPILKMRYTAFRKLNNPCPWLSPTSVKFLKSYLTKDMVGFEYGSGISTLFLSPKVKHLTSVEHNSEWYSLITNRMKESNITNVDYKFIGKESPNEVEFDQNLLNEYNFESRKDYVTYYTAINELEPESLDFVIVDGRARPECIYFSLPKLKKNAMIILDNSEREHYKIVFKMLEKYDSYTTTNGLTDTTFWFKNDIA